MSQSPRSNPVSRRRVHLWASPHFKIVSGKSSAGPEQRTHTCSQSRSRSAGRSASPDEADGARQVDAKRSPTPERKPIRSAGALNIFLGPDVPAGLSTCEESAACSCVATSCWALSAGRSNFMITSCVCRRPCHRSRGAEVRLEGVNPCQAAVCSLSA